IEPGRAAQVPRIAHETLAVQVVSEDLLAESDRAILIDLVQPGSAPRLFTRLHDEGAGVAVEAIGMELEPTPGRVFESEGESVQLPVRPEPDVTALAHINVGLEVLSVLAADDAVDPVRSDDEIGIGERRVVRDFGLEHLLDTQLGGARLQDIQ